MEINYDEVDVECRDLVRLFNECGLKTKYSCQGHNGGVLDYYYIMFDDNITDSHIESFIGKFENKHSHSPFVGKFVKWMRKIPGEIKCNWMYQLTGKDDLENYRRAKIDLETFRKNIELEEG